LVVAAGREHRDYATMSAALGELGLSVLVTRSSIHSAHAMCREPEVWPRNFTVGQLSYRDLRAQYARAAVVVVPMLPTDYQAGVTALLEAMAMGKAVVVTATEGLAELVRDGVNAVLVPAGDPVRMRAAVERLVGDAGERARLGESARRTVESEYALGRFCGRIADELARLVPGSVRLAAAVGGPS
jgi:glycosyltransferase involved in cell wall biosynthesis